MTKNDAKLSHLRLKTMPFNKKKTQIKINKITESV